MYISKKNRELIRLKFGGRCAYSGTPLEDDWQVDHIEPLIRDAFTGIPLFPNAHREDNLVPVQKIINHYKGSLGLETFRTWFMRGLHERLAKLPKKPITEKSIRKIEYMNKVASYFGVTAQVPFSGVFYFETINNNPTP